MRLPYVKPENALQRAEELLQVNAPLEALNVLHTTLSARRSRNFVAVSLEPLVLKFLTLAVNHRRDSLAREGLHYYKKLAQSSSVASVEKVVRHFLHVAENQVKIVRARHAKQDGSDLMIQNIDDLDTPDTFDAVFSAMVTSLEEGGTMVVPKRERDPCTASIAFLWEAYRMVLDLLRNNAMFEMLYQQTAKKAFDFCVTYKRKNEFRRLSDALNLHLQSLHRPQQATQRHQTASINLTDPDVLQRYLDTRFLQLQTASDLELWQESFRSAEDICGLLLKAADAIAPSESHFPSSMTSTLLPYSLFANKKHGTKLMQILIQYYGKLTQIFAYSEDPTFLAAAWNEYYSWTIHAKNSYPISEETQHKMASYVVLTALSSPVLPIPAASELTQRNHRKDRLTKMLGWSHAPDRALLLADILKKNILSYSHPVLQELYRILETEFHPLKTAARLRAFLPQVQAISEFQSYLPALISVVTTKLLKHLAKIYTCMSFDHLLSLVQVTPTMTLFDLEKLLSQFHRVSGYDVRTDHLHQSFTFQEKVSSPPHVDLLFQLPLSKTQDFEDKSILFKRARETMTQEHAHVHARQEMIEKRKQYMENFEQEQLERERQALLKRQQEERETVQRKLAEATRHKELEKIKREQEAVKKTEAKKLSETMKAKAGITIKKSESLTEIGREELLIIQEHIHSKEREALEQELAQVMRKLDHMERAIRKEEMPLLEKAKEEEKDRTRELTAALRKKALEEAKERHAQALVIMKRVQRMRKEAQVYRHKMEEERKEYLEAIRESAKKELLEAKKKRREEVRSQIRQKLEAEKEMKRIAREEEKAREEARKKQEEEQRELEFARGLKQNQEAGIAPWEPSAKAMQSQGEKEIVRSQKPAVAAAPTAEYSAPSAKSSTPPIHREPIVEASVDAPVKKHVSRDIVPPKASSDTVWRKEGKENEEKQVMETKKSDSEEWLPESVKAQASKPYVPKSSSDMKRNDAHPAIWRPSTHVSVKQESFAPKDSKEEAWRSSRGIDEKEIERSVEDENAGWRRKEKGGSSHSHVREIGSSHSSYNKGYDQRGVHRPENNDEPSNFQKSRRQDQTGQGDIRRREKN